MNTLDDMRLRALLSEHYLTRQEITATNGRKVRLFQLYLLSLTGGYGYNHTSVQPCPRRR